MDTVTDSTDYTNLYTGAYPVTRGPITVTDGETLAIGAVVGLVTTTGHALKLDHSASDGSENFYGVVLEAITTSGSTGVTTVAKSGEFNTGELSFAGSTVYGDVTADMRDKNCYQKTITDTVGA